MDETTKTPGRGRRAGAGAGAGAGEAARAGAGARQARAGGAAASGERTGPMKDWRKGRDGSLSRTFTHASAEDTGKAARRALKQAETAKLAVELLVDGPALTVRFPGIDGAVNDEAKKLARRMGRPAGGGKKAAEGAPATEEA